MVKTRTVKNDAKNLKKYYDQMLKRWGSTFTVERETITRDSMGNVTGTSTTTFSGVKGEFQRIFSIKDLMALGLTGDGNAKFYADTTTVFYEGDIITVQSKKWKFRKKIEDDEYGYDDDGLGRVGVTWLLVRLDG